MKTFFTLLMLSLFTICFSQTEEEMKVWMEYMTPSEMHKKIADDNGTWFTSNTIWMAPETPPFVTKGTAENSMIMGGRYQQSKFEGDFNGMPFEGLSTLSYDNSTKEFTSTWIDNFGTGMMVMRGKYDNKTSAIHLNGKMVDPMTGKIDLIREVFSYIDENTQKLEMFTTKEGKEEYKSMELVFNRKLD